MVDPLAERLNLAGSDNLDVFGGRFVGGYHLQQNPTEFAAALNIVKTLGPFKRLLEIGSAGGGSARVLFEILNLEELYLIDDNQHSKSAYRAENLAAVPHQEFIGNSHSKEAAAWVKALNVTFDLVFIDGDHSAEGVIADTELALSVAPQGVFMYHDTLSHPSVYVALKQLVLEKKLEWFGQVNMRHGMAVLTSPTRSHQLTL